MPTVLVIDDDKIVRHLIGEVFRDTEINVVTASTADEGLHALDATTPDVALLDIMLAGSSGLDLFREIHARDARLPVIFITASEDSDTVIQAIKLGAYDYLLKPLDMPKIREIVHRAVATRRLNCPVDVDARMLVAVQTTTERKADSLVGCSPEMQRVYKDIGRVAEADVTVLIHGESGTGKELVARAICQHSPRSGGRFLAVNCAAIPDALLESELFGHEKGSFTGADARRMGKFEQCAGGTLFLDEIGDMSPMVQGKMLRVLQEREFQRVGGNEVLKADVRVITATHRDLERMVEERTFRQDLYYRLSTFTVELPALRDRIADLPLLLRHFLDRYNRELHREVRGYSAEAMQVLLQYSWPGNIRELQNVLRQGILQATGSIMSLDALPSKLQNETGSMHASSTAQPGHAVPADAADAAAASLRDFIDLRTEAKSTNLYAESLEMMEKYLLERVLNNAHGNQSVAAEVLGITRGSLRHKIRALGLSIDRSITFAEPTLSARC